MITREQLVSGDVTLPRLLRERAAEKGAALALREKEHGIWKRYDWNHYYLTARRVAHGLLALGLKRGDRIAIASENNPEWFYADLGAEMLGVVVVGIYPTNPWPELQYIVRHCGARIAFCGDQEQSDKVFDAMANSGGLPAMEKVICIDMKGMRPYKDKPLLSFEALLALGDEYVRSHPGAEAALDTMIDETKPDDTCIMVYTSGTTGPPKGAMLSHRNLIYSAFAYAEAIDIADRGFESVAYLPLCHVAERCYSMVLQLVLGGRVNFAESIDTVAMNIREIAPTFFVGVPRIYEKLIQNFNFRMKDSGLIQQKLYAWAFMIGRGIAERRTENAGQLGLGDRITFFFLYWLVFRNIQRHMGLNRVRNALCAGASVSPETLRYFSIIGRPVSQGYGLTECAGVAFIQTPTHHRLGGCGLPMRGTEWKLAPDGEICLRNPGVFQGYYFDNAASNATIDPEGWLHSGDIVEVMENGEITVVDRKKAIIITSGGKNISPSEIENALKDSAYIKEAIVVGEARKFLGALIQVDYETVGRWAREQGLAYTTYKSLAALKEVVALVQDVVNEVNGKFARVENVRRFVILEKELDHDDGELTATQKVRRSIINKKFARELEQIYGAGA